MCVAGPSSVTGRAGRHLVGSVVHDVPAWVIDKWEFRETYIGQGEILAGPLALTIVKNRMTIRDITWYVDSQGALAALINTSTVTSDNSPMTFVAGLMAVLMQPHI